MCIALHTVLLFICMFVYVFYVCVCFLCLCMFFMFVYVLVELMLHSFTDLGMLCMILPILAMAIQDERTGGLLVVLLAWQLFPTWRAPHTTTYSIYIYLQQHCPCCRARLDHNNSTSLSLSLTHNVFMFYFALLQIYQLCIVSLLVMVN